MPIRLSVIIKYLVAQSRRLVQPCRLEIKVRNYFSGLDARVHYNSRTETEETISFDTSKDGTWCQCYKKNSFVADDEAK